MDIKKCTFLNFFSRYAISLAYNVMRGYPLLSYMEDPFLVIQTTSVLLLVYFYVGELKLKTFGVLAGGAVIFYLLTLDPTATILPMLLVK